jgi:glutaredoxin
MIAMHNIPKEKARVLLYTKPGCHLCEKVKEQIRNAQCSELYTFEEVNIEGDRELFERYRYEIPVLLINGVEAFRHRVRADEFKAYLMKL